MHVARNAVMEIIDEAEEVAPWMVNHWLSNIWWGIEHALREAVELELKLAALRWDDFAYRRPGAEIEIDERHGFGVVRWDGDSYERSDGEAEFEDALKGVR